MFWNEGEFLGKQEKDERPSCGVTRKEVSAQSLHFRRISIILLLHHDRKGKIPERRSTDMSIIHQSSVGSESLTCAENTLPCGNALVPQAFYHVA